MSAKGIDLDISIKREEEVKVSKDVMPEQNWFTEGKSIHCFEYDKNGQIIEVGCSPIIIIGSR